jgi:hypothetical protein
VKMQRSTAMRPAQVRAKQPALHIWPYRDTSGWPRMGRYGDALKPDPAGQPVSCGLRRDLQPPLRGGLHARHRRSRRSPSTRSKSSSPNRNWTRKERFIPVCENDEGRQWDDIRIAVIGAGPAGMSCAYYLRTRGYPVTVFEKESRPGGMLLNGIPNFRLEKRCPECRDRYPAQNGRRIPVRDTEVGKDVSIAELRKEGYRAFYIRHRRAGRKAYGCARRRCGRRGDRRGFPAQGCPGSEYKASRATSLWSAAATSPSTWLVLRSAQRTEKSPCSASKAAVRCPLPLTKRRMPQRKA